MIKSRGAIIYRLNNGTIEYLMIQHTKGEHWGFPKGKKHPGEKKTETAKREIREEIGLSVEFCNDFKIKDTYTIKGSKKKEVIYFLSRIKFDSQITIDKKEIMDYRWVTFEDAVQLTFFDSLRDILKFTDKYIKKTEKI